jgi:hypothetical protein
MKTIVDWAVGAQASCYGVNLAPPNGFCRPALFSDGAWLKSLFFRQGTAEEL